MTTAWWETPRSLSEMVEMWKTHPIFVLRCANVPRSFITAALNFELADNDVIYLWRTQRPSTNIPTQESNMTSGTVQYAWEIATEAERNNALDALSAKDPARLLGWDVIALQHPNEPRLRAFAPQPSSPSFFMEIL